MLDNIVSTPGPGFVRLGFLAHFDLWKSLKKFWWVVVVVAFLNIVSTPGPGIVKVKARFPGSF